MNSDDVEVIYGATDMKTNTVRVTLKAPTRTDLETIKNMQEDYR